MEGGDESQHSAPTTILILTPPNLPLFNRHAPSVTAHSPGAETPPLQTLASVPFRWEERPGKPRPCTARPQPIKCLELPPCKASKTPSPTAVLDGPYNDLGRPNFSSLRYFRDSFDGYSGGSSSPADDAALIGDRCITRQKATGLFGRSLRWNMRSGQKEDDRGAFGFSPSPETHKGKNQANTSRNPKSTRLWASICKSLKQVIPWSSANK